MNHNEAIKYIRHIRDNEYVKVLRENKDGTTWAKKTVEALELALKALKAKPDDEHMIRLKERDTPKRPERDWNEAGEWFECPYCGDVLEGDGEYCGNCGQRIDWPEEEEE